MPIQERRVLFGMTTRKEKLVMKAEIVSAPHQRECKACSRFTILKTPCRSEACIYRQREAQSAR